MGRATVASRGVPFASICFYLLFGTYKPVRADFKLPILHPVPKVISIPEKGSADLLESFIEVRNLAIEIRMKPGGLISEGLVRYLEDRFPNTTKRIVASGLFRSLHVGRYRKLFPMEMRYELGLATLDPKTINSLYALGPVRKMLVLDQKFSHASLDKVRKLKFFVPVVRMSKDGLRKEQLNWLSEDNHRPTVLVLPPGFNPVHLHDVSAIHPLKLEVHTVKNRIDEGLMSALAKLKKVDITVVVDGGFTMQDARNLVLLDRFSLKVHLDHTDQLIPGLASLLNQIGPP